ncbi:MAG: hypothetical protein ACOYI8_08530, partial [Christensenellales bacterium]
FSVTILSDMVPGSFQNCGVVTSFYQMPVNRVHPFCATYCTLSAFGYHSFANPERFRKTPLDRTTRAV